MWICLDPVTCATKHAVCGDLDQDPDKGTGVYKTAGAAVSVHCYREHTTHHPPNLDLTVHNQTLDLR